MTDFPGMLVQQVLNTADEDMYIHSTILDESCSKPDLSSDLSLIELHATPSLVITPKASRRVIIPVKRLTADSPLLQRPPPIQVRRSHGLGQYHSCFLAHVDHLQSIGMLYPIKSMPYR